MDSKISSNNKQLQTMYNKFNNNFQLQICSNSLDQFSKAKCNKLHSCSNSDNSHKYCNNKNSNIKEMATPRVLLRVLVNSRYKVNSNNRLLNLIYCIHNLWITPVSSNKSIIRRPGTKVVWTLVKYQDQIMTTHYR